MLEQSFCFLPGIGQRRERELWRQGIHTWRAFLSAGRIAGIGALRKAEYDRAVGEAQARRAQEDARYFGVRLHQREHWRLYEWLRPRTLYLDIETDALGRISVVGLYGNGTFTQLFRGESLTARRLADEVAQYELLVTYNGTAFDLPMLLGWFPDLPLDQPHLDLCLVSRRLGYRGGLKSVERQVGITRASDIIGLRGDDAVRLWNRWRHSRDQAARDLLSAYNEADCLDLQPLADHCYARLVASLCSEFALSPSL